MNRSEKSRKRTSSKGNRSEKRGHRSNMPRWMIEDLMGIGQPVYERHNHALRRKGR